MADWSALYLHEHLGSRESVAAIGFLVFSLTMLTGRFPGDGIVAKLGPVTVIRTCAIVATAGLLFGIAVDEIWSVLIEFGAVGPGLSIVIPLVYGGAGNTLRIPGGRGVASMAPIGYTGFLAGPTALVWIAEATSLRFAMLIVVMLSGVVILMADQADPRLRVPAG